MPTIRVFSFSQDTPEASSATMPAVLIGRVLLDVGPLALLLDVFRRLLVERGVFGDFGGCARSLRASIRRRHGRHLAWHDGLPVAEINPGSPDRFQAGEWGVANSE